MAVSMKRNAFAITILLMFTLLVYQFVDTKQRIDNKESTISSLESELEELKEKVKETNEDISRYNRTLHYMWDSRTYEEVYRASQEFSTIDEIDLR